MPDNWVICNGESNIVVFDLGSSVDIDYPVGTDVMNVTTEYLLPTLLGNAFNTRFETSFRFTALELALSVSGFEIIPGFTVFPEICIFGLCTPEVRFPGLSSPPITIGPLGPVLDETVSLPTLDLPQFFDVSPFPWVLGGFNSVPGATLVFDPQREAIPVIRIGPTNLREGEEGTWDCNDVAGSDSRDIAEPFTCTWDFGDGTGALGKIVTHSYDDNAGAPGVTYTVTLTVDDGHNRPVVITRDVDVDNVTPTLKAGTDKTTFEGTPVGLGVGYPFGVNLISNPNAEAGTAAWSGAGFIARPYALASDPTLASLNLFDRTLIFNGGAEGGTAGWSGNLSSSSYTVLGVPAPAGAGARVFDGGGNFNTSGGQTFDVSDTAALIDEDGVNFDLSAFLGGQGAEPDDAGVTATFRDAVGNPIGNAILGPVTAADRGNVTQLLPRFASGTVPRGTRSISVDLEMKAPPPPVPPAESVFFGEFKATEISQLQLNGSTAFLNPNVFENLWLTSGPGQAGSAFLKDSISLANDASFSTQFPFLINNPQENGGDGLAFVVAPSPSSLGLGGGGIGYSGLNNIMAIEFDHFNNGAPCDGNTFSHVAIHFGDFCSPFVIADLAFVDGNIFPFALADGLPWYAWIDYDGVTDILEVRVSHFPSRPTDPLFNIFVDLPAVLGQTDAFIGFTAGTGASSANHIILSWGFTFQPPTPPFNGNQALADNISLTLSAPNTNLAGTPAGGFPKLNSPGPVNRQLSYFSSTGTTTIGVQDIDVSPGADVIDAGGATFGLRGFLGGHAGQEDLAGVVVLFKDAGGTPIGPARTIGPVSRAERSGSTGMLQRSLDGNVPVGTRSVQVQVGLAHLSGAFNDASVDALSLIFRAVTGANLEDDGLADTHTALINWGDLSPLQAALVNQARGEAVFSQLHTYGDNGVYDVVVTAQDDDHILFNNGQVSDGFQVTVLNVPPTVIGQDNTFVRDETPLADLLLATFTDPGFNDRDFTATVNWGDGTPLETDTGSINVTVDQGNLRVTGRHTYSSAIITGPYPRNVTASITVTDKDGGSTIVFVTNLVTDLVIPFVAAGPDRGIPEGSSVTVNGSSQAVLPVPFPVNLRYEYEWNFGDFSPPFVQQIAGGAAIPPLTPLNNLTAIPSSHSYSDDGQAVVALTVRGYSLTNGKLQTAKIDYFIVTISNAPPVIASMNIAPTPPEGTTVVLSATYTDLGLADTHTALINWGDGSPVEAGLVTQQTTTAAPGSVSGSHVYADNAARTVTLEVCDDDGACVTLARSVNVLNAPPSNVSAGAPQTFTEGDPISLSGAGFTDVPADTHTATIDWDDGTVESGTVNQVADTVAGSHVYGDGSTHVVEVCVTDDDNATDCGSVGFTVLNANPVVNAGLDKFAQEGEVVPLIATFTDAGADDIHTALIDWGDGTSSDPAAVDQTTRSVSGSHVYAQDGTYTITVEVRDDDYDGVNGVGSDTLDVDITNVRVEFLELQLTSGGRPVTVEGSTLNITVPFNDKGTLDGHTATVDWGDGTATDDSITGGVTVTEDPDGPPGSEDGTDGTVAASHVYADNGRYTITVCISDDDETTCGTTTATVGNVVPTVFPGPDQVGALEGSPVSLPSATYSDPGFDRAVTPTEENFTATIDWGDGTTEPVDEITVTEVSGDAASPTTGTVQASHIYGDNGQYTVTICVADDDHAPGATVPADGEGCSTLKITVDNVAPSLEAGPDRVTVEGATFSLIPATFSDPGFDVRTGDTLEDFTATIDWGDDNTEPAGDIILGETPGDQEVATTGTIQAIHNYGDDGFYTVTVCVIDDDDGSDCDTLEVEVRNRNPVLDDSVFLDTKITFPSGDDAFLGRKGVLQIHGAEATDSGSDDLRYDWEFVPSPDRFGGTLPSLPVTESTTTFNDGSAPGTLPFTDPPPEDDVNPHLQGTFPFTSTDTVDVTFTGPGVYVVELLVSDDNSDDDPRLGAPGTDSISLTKLVVDDCDCTKSQGFWKHEFKTRKEKDLKKVEKGKLISEETLEAYLDIIRFASSHFGVDTVVPLNNFQEANLILNGNKGNSGSGNGNGNSNGTNQPWTRGATTRRRKRRRAIPARAQVADPRPRTTVATTVGPTPAGRPTITAPTPVGMATTAAQPPT